MVRLVVVIRNFILFLFFVGMAIAILFVFHSVNLFYFAALLLAISIILVFLLGDKIILSFVNAKYFQVARSNIEVLKNSDLLMGLGGTVIYSSYKIGDSVLLMDKPFGPSRIIIGEKVLKKLSNKEIESLIWECQANLKRGIGRTKFYSTWIMALILIPEYIVEMIYNVIVNFLESWFKFLKPIVNVLKIIKPHLFLRFVNYPLTELIHSMSSNKIFDSVEKETLMGSYSAQVLSEKIGRERLIKGNIFLIETIKNLSLFEDRDNNLLSTLKKAYS